MCISVCVSCAHSAMAPALQKVFCLHFSGKSIFTSIRHRMAWRSHGKDNEDLVRQLKGKDGNGVCFKK